MNWSIHFLHLKHSILEQKKDSSSLNRSAHSTRLLPDVSLSSFETYKLMIYSLFTNHHQILLVCNLSCWDHSTYRAGYCCNSALSLYSGDIGFEPRPVDPQSWLRFLVVLPSLSERIYIYLGHSSRFENPSLLIIRGYLPRSLDILISAV